MLITNNIKKIAILTILPFVILINSCEQATVKPVTKKNTCIDDDLEKYLIAFYPFDNGSLKDVTGNGWDLQKSNVPNDIQLVNGRNNSPNCAYKFLKNPDAYLYIDLSNKAEQFEKTINDGELSISLWVNSESPRFGGEIEYLFSTRFNANSNLKANDFYISLYDLRRPNVNWNKKYLWDNPTNLGLDFNTIMDFYSNKWINLTFTLSKNKMSIYINGVLNNSGVGDNISVSGVEAFTKFYIGERYFGTIDDIMIFNKELNASEVKRIFETEPCCSSN